VREERSLFIALEGGEGAGKSVQTAALVQRLRDLGHRVKSIREPGGTALGERLRDILLNREEMEPVSETLLFFAARAQLIAEVIGPALERGEIVISDRFTDSTRAYQGFGRGVSRTFIEQLNAMLPGDGEPDLKVLLDLPVNDGLARAGKCGAIDRFEAEEIAFHERVREGFLALAASDPERWLVLDGRRDVRDITEQILERVFVLLDDTP
jgi:dTMP kinase